MLRALAFDVVQDVKVFIVVLDLIPVHEILQQQHLTGRIRGEGREEVPESG